MVEVFKETGEGMGDKTGVVGCGNFVDQDVYGNMSYELWVLSTIVFFFSFTSFFMLCNE